jgi:hypothetical protein
MARQTKTVKIYIEGGGDGKGSKALKSEMRQAFQTFFKGWGLESVLPSVVACGARNQAFEDFKTAIKNPKPDGAILLLVDSEDYPSSTSKWKHVAQRDSWIKPEKVTEQQLYFMAVCMESWFMVNTQALADFYGQGFQVKQLPKVSTNQAVEQLSKPAIYNGLANATRNTQKGEYGKGAHSFKILAKIDASKVLDHGQYAQELHAFLHCHQKNDCKETN